MNLFTSPTVIAPSVMISDAHHSFLTSRTKRRYKTRNTRSPKSGIFPFSRKSESLCVLPKCRYSVMIKEYTGHSRAAITEITLTKGNTQGFSSHFFGISGAFCSEIKYFFTFMTPFCGTFKVSFILKHRIYCITITRIMQYCNRKIFLIKIYK